ncbi:MAG: nucleoside phosphorylase [Clostridia bacterium]|nr:nucleoside phosphorylase [Clostridia bacterium]
MESFYGPKKHLVEKCLVIFSKVIYDEMFERHECEKLAEVGACNGNIPVWKFDNAGEDTAFYLTPIGSAICAGTVAEVSHLTGAEKFIMFGSCGSLDSETTGGKFIVPTEAYRGEGMSHYFAKANDYIRVGNSDRVAEIFTELNIPFVQGRVWTTDTMLRETVNLVNKRKSEGCIAVEMELAGVQAVCDYYGFELYDFLAAGDVVAEGNYDVKGLADANHNTDKLAIALEIAKRI